MPGLTLGLGLGLSPSQGAGLPAVRNANFGVNLSGPEFAPWNGQTFPSSANWLYLASKSVGFVRMPIAWESIQPTLGVALDATYLAALKASIAMGKTFGIDTIVGIHNFGYYITNAKWIASDGVVAGYAGNDAALATGVNVLGDGTLTQAEFADLWTRLTTALTGTSGLKGLGIMNEPAPGIIGVNMLPNPDVFNVGGWFGTGGASVASLGAGSNPLGAAYGPAWTLTVTSAFTGVFEAVNVSHVPYTESIWVRSHSGTVAGFFYLNGTSTAFTATTSWQRLSGTCTPTAGSAVLCGIGLNAAGVIDIANSQLELGSSASTYAPNIWMPFAQAAINAIRAVDATIKIYVCGYNFGTASRWNSDNFELAALTGGNLIFEAHQYFDGAQNVGNGGNYSGTYTSYSIDSTSGAGAFDVFKNWCTSQGVAGFIGEFGVPNRSNDNDAAWLPLQLAMEQDVKAAGMQACQWFFGCNGIQSSNILNIAAANDARLLQMLAA